jgi:SAM-dependent methyltransferase
MAQSKTTWGMGDYPRMALELEPVAAAAVHSVPVGPEVRVLDIATGTGNAAMMAAQLGAVVTAVDIEPVLIEVAEQRASMAGADIQWLLGDCEHLPVPDVSADCGALNLWCHVRRGSRCCGTRARSGHGTRWPNRACFLATRKCHARHGPGPQWIPPSATVKQWAAQPVG